MYGKKSEEAPEDAQEERTSAQEQPRGTKKASKTSQKTAKTNPTSPKSNLNEQNMRKQLKCQNTHDFIEFKPQTWVVKYKIDSNKSQPTIRFVCCKNCVRFESQHVQVKD